MALWLKAMEAMASAGAAPSPEQLFWQWFIEHEQLLFDSTPESEHVFDVLRHALHQVDSNLTFEFGPMSQGKREFTVSADGIRSAFPAVERLAEVAPPLQRWTIVKFRQRTTTDFILNLGGREVDTNDVETAIIVNDGKIDIALFIQDFREEDREPWTQIGYILLDSLLGEYDVEMKAGGIGFFAFDHHPEWPRFPLPELPARFDAAFAPLKQ